MTNRNIEAFYKAYAAALRDGTAALFAGAGLSIPAGMVDWGDLLRDIAEDIGLDVDKEHDLVSVAQFHVNEKGGRHRISQKLLDEFSDKATCTENHKILASLPIETYWTTNYDSLIEDSLRAAHRKPDVKRTTENLALSLHRRDAVVYKMHGDVTLPDQAVIVRDDYEAYDKTRELFSTALRGDLVSKTFLFVGFSFSDPNLSYVLARVRVLLGQNRREHFCLLKRVQRDDFDTEDEYDYAKIRQDLQVRDLGRYGIQGLLVDSYAAYTEVLRELASRYRASRILISGSSATYEPWDDKDAEELLAEVGRRLILADYDLVTGFGLGVGPFVLNGLLTGLGEGGTYSMHDRATLRPFPQGGTDAEELQRRWTEYRRQMISLAGVALFLFGTRADADGNIEPAQGVQEEFELAVGQGLAVVPVGCTGGAAKSLHEMVMRDFDRYYPTRPDLKDKVQVLGDPGTPSEVVNRVLAVLRALKE